jgi:hypothetical protein
MGLRGDLGSIRALKKRLSELPLSFAHNVSQAAAPAMTDLTEQAFDSGQTVYDEPRPQGVDGGLLTLRATGATKRELRFTAQGTVIRAVLGTRYARYLIGKYGILPNGPIPARWSRKLRELVIDQTVKL